MLDVFPANLLDGVGVVGLVTFIGWMLFTGRLATRRELDAKDRQIEALTQINTTKDATISDFREAISTSNAMIRALLDLAKERSR